MRKTKQVLLNTSPVFPLNRSDSQLSVENTGREWRQECRQKSIRKMLCVFPSE